MTKRRRRDGGRGIALLVGASLGAVAMYALDPERGRRRRALARDKVESVARRSGRRLQAVSRDLANRTQGLVARARTVRERRDERDDERHGGSTSGEPRPQPGHRPEPAGLP